MGMTSFYTGSLRYSPCGRKRKNHAANRVKKKPTVFKTKSLQDSQLEKMRNQQANQYKSLMEEAIKDGTFSKMGTSGCTKKEPMQYTGTLVKGIATMHKSNAVPVINQQEAIDIANMRRN